MTNVLVDRVSTRSRYFSPGFPDSPQTSLKGDSRSEMTSYGLDATSAKSCDDSKVARNAAKS
jgi:hypothetical protein